MMPVEWCYGIDIQNALLTHFPENIGAKCRIFTYYVYGYGHWWDQTKRTCYAQNNFQQ